MKMTNIVDYPKFRTEIVKAIRNGETAVLPFDTVYGLAANPFCDDSMDRLYKIKGRNFNKPVALIFASIEMLKKFISISSDQEKFICQRTPGEYTFIIPWRIRDKKKFSKHYQKLEKIGARIPNYKFILDFAKEIDQPIAATSSNVSGNDNCWNVDDFLEQINNSNFKPDFIIDAGELSKNPPSEIIDISDINNIETLRK